MKQKKVKIQTILLVIQIFIIGIFLVNNSYGAIIDIESDYGHAPKIDGDSDSSDDEWENATKEVIFLKGTSPTDAGIPVELWVLQNKSDLYIAIQFELNTHKSEEFIGILISNSEASNDESFVDAKILQFYNLGTSYVKSSYLDFYIRNGIFYLDSDVNGDAAAELEGNKIVYEFRIPVNDTKDDKDAELDFGEEYAFKIVYGDNMSYPNGFLKSNIVLIEITYFDEPPPNVWIMYHNILCIIIFCGLGVLFALYTFKIISIKKKIRRITSENV